MAIIKRFRKPPVGPERPAGLSADARAEWDRMITSLAHVGMLRLVTAAALTRYVQQFARAETVYAELADLRTLASRLVALSNRLRGRDSLTVIDAYLRVIGLEQAHGATVRRLSLAMLRFLRDHRLTPRSRQKGVDNVR
jgi:hypothetical protein